jgi:hypothetical protein
LNNGNLTGRFRPAMRRCQREDNSSASGFT